MRREGDAELGSSVTFWNPNSGMQGRWSKILHLGEMRELLVMRCFLPGHFNKKTCPRIKRWRAYCQSFRELRPVQSLCDGVFLRFI